MKNQIVKREMGQYDVLQRTSDGMFNASELMRQWNTESKKQKSIAEFLKAKGTQEYIEALTTELGKPDFGNLQNGNESGLGRIDAAENQQVTLTRTIKGRAMKGGGRTPDTVWMHPLLFIEFAGYFSPKFRVKVNQFVLDHLIEYRNKIGDRWPAFTAAAAKIGCRTQDDFKVIARCLNCAVLGADRQKDQRNSLTAASPLQCWLVELPFSFALSSLVL